MKLEVFCTKKKIKEWFIRYNVVLRLEINL